MKSMIIIIIIIIIVVHYKNCHADRQVDLNHTIEIIGLNLYLTIKYIKLRN